MSISTRLTRRLLTLETSNIFPHQPIVGFEGQKTFFVSMIAVVLLVSILLAAPTRAQSLGVCYGMLGDDLPEPSEVVALCKSNNIDRIRLYSPDRAALLALRNSNIQVLLDVPSSDLQALASNSSAAADWVQTNVAPFWPSVAFRYIAVGNEALPDGPAKHVLPAMRNIRTALSSAGGMLDQIKVSVPVSTKILGVSFPPSAGDFSSDSVEFLIPIVEFLAGHGAPLLLKVYPYFTYTSNPSQISLSYALFNSSQVVVQDGELSYRSLFDAMVDAAYAALERAGGPTVPIVVAESGWPSAGAAAASIDNARTYNQNLIKHVGEGTPRKPGEEIETYIFAMFNENQKPGSETERNFGLFYPDKQSVYPLNFGESESIVAGDVTVSVKFHLPY